MGKKESTPKPKAVEADVQPAMPATNDDAPVRLEIAKVTPIDLQSVIITYGKKSCDSSGSVYVGMYPGPEGPKPLARVNRDGKIEVKFREKAEDVEPGDFFVRDRDVYELVTEYGKKPTVTIVKFTKDGSVDSKVTLEEGFFSYGRFGVFKSGEILLAGIDSRDTQQVRSYTALFGADGKLVKRIELEDDERIQKAISGHDELFVPRGENHRGNLAVSLGAVLSAEDGNLYLMRHTLPALIYVISPAGEIVRQFSVGSGDAFLRPSVMFERDGQLAVGFNHWGSPPVDVATRIKVVNASNGEVIRTYDANVAIGSGLTCFEPPDRFVFFGVDMEKKQMVLRETRP